MNQKPKVSVVMPSYNHVAHIGAAIESILSQTLQDFELIIVDDGSTDDSWNVIQAYANSDGRIIAIRQENEGPSAATNRAISEVRGEFIAAHTSDDRSASSRLQKQVAFLESHPDHDAVATFIEEIDGNGQIRPEGEYEAWFNTPADISHPSSWVWKNMVASPTLMLRRGFFQRYGSYDRDLIYTQDWEMWIRALSRGGKMAVLPEKLLQYRLHGDNLTHRDAKRTFWEYAYVSSKILHPWLINTENDNLVLRNIIEFVRHDVFTRLNQNDRDLLASALLRDCNGTFAEFSLKRSDDHSSHRIEARVIEAYAQTQSKVDQLCEDREQLRAERDQLRRERDQLLAQTSSLSYRAVRRAKNSLRARAPWVHRIVSFLIRATFRLWQNADIYLRLVPLRARLNTQVVTNTLWPEGTPLVSVIIPCFNYGKYLNEAIDSVLAQTFQDVEIIVVDDGSTDPYTVHVLETLERPKTRKIRQKNEGLAGSRNNGIREARGKYICCLDADDMLTPTYLEKAVYLLETRNLDLCYSWVQAFEDEDWIWKTSPFDIEDLAKGNVVSVSAVYKKSIWERSGGYKKFMTQGFEDWEFWLTLAEAGAQGHRIPEPLFLYRKHGRSMFTEANRVKLKLSNDIKTLHPALYSGQASLAKLRRQHFKQFVVKQPLCNMIRTRDLPVNSVSQLKVLVAVPWFDLGGSSVLLKEVFSSLKTKGTVVTAIATNPAEHLVNETGLPLYESYTKDCFNLPALFERRADVGQFIEYLISSRKIQLLFLAGSSVVYENLPRLKKIFPRLVVIDQLYNKVGHVDSNRKYCRYIDLTIVPNEEVRDHLLELGESSDRLRLIPHGIDTERFDTGSFEYATASKKRPPEVVTFGYLGRLSSEKRPRDIVQLAAMLPECQFVIGGCGPMENVLQDEITSRGLAERVYLKGQITDVMEFYAGIDALIIPSEIEGLPLVLLEAMALGLPVIATKVGRIPLAISHGENGFLYEVGDLEQLRRLAGTLIALSKEERKRIGEAARSTVLKEYNIGKCTESYFRIFVTALGLSDL